MDRNWTICDRPKASALSPPARVAWIETLFVRPPITAARVSPPARVAWIETSAATTTWPSFSKVATREGGVDRNTSSSSVRSVWAASPPARVAWIETRSLGHRVTLATVATREGGVDRNINLLIHYGGMTKSPPARVAWIETILDLHLDIVHAVATREGGVDRNIAAVGADVQYLCRHPRGWRG